jgi:DNA-directed RNA polymerase specialized sigma24 family protein
MNKRVSRRQANQSLESYTILQRIGQAEKGAVEDCVYTYGNLVWALAKRFARSSEEAEQAAMDIFNDIWARAAFYDAAKCTEKKYVLQIAARRLIKPPTRAG